MARIATIVEKIKVPTAHDWRTTDAEEIERRRARARDESFAITNLDSAHPIFSNFRIQSGSGLTYSVEIRSVADRQFSCSCIDFRINGLGTCKHAEAVLLNLEARFQKLFRQAGKLNSNRIDIVVGPGAANLRALGSISKLPKALRSLFDRNGWVTDCTPEEAVERLSKTDVPEVRISQEIGPWLETRRHAIERKELRKEYELKVQSGEWPAQETNVPLFPYQREGMLHLAFAERGLLADEMGLGKTIQAIAACALLHRLGKAQRVLVVTPASLKTEWEDQIQRFTRLPYQLVFGGPKQRVTNYLNAPFFTIVNYEQMVKDALNVNTHLNPDIVVLDEAQRIKNWNTLTAQAVKRLRSRYAFVLTGTPIENRIDELHSLMDFLNPAVLGPLFRFNRDFYEFDERGRPSAFKNLGQLHERIAPYMLRRRKAEVETELPDRTDKNFFVKLSPGQQATYEDHKNHVARLIHASKRRPLTQQEQDKLMREMAMMRMVCDTNYILDPDDKVCPKLAELEKVLEECRANEDVKVIIFSEWERMLQLVKELCQKHGFGYAWHTGSVPQLKRRAEINLFKSDPKCRVFLTTDSGSTGLNLQNASVVINCDLPWNPAKLEQRIARAWRKNQTRPVTVINLVSENTIEHGMLGTLANKQALADGVLELKGDLSKIQLRGGKQSFLERLSQLITQPAPAAVAAPKPKPLPVDRARAFAEMAREKINGAMVRCEEQYPLAGAHSVLFVVVDQEPAKWREQLGTLHEELFGPGKTDPLSPTYFEVVDRNTADTLERLVQAGLIQRTSRGSRPLLGDGPVTEARVELSDDENQKATSHRQQAARRLKMGTILASNDLLTESRDSLLQATHALGCALAIENRTPEPKEIIEMIAPRIGFWWGEHLPTVRQFVADDTTPWQGMASALDQLIKAPVSCTTTAV